MPVLTVRSEWIGMVTWNYTTHLNDMDGLIVPSEMFLDLGGGMFLLHFNYHRAREPLKKMGIAVDDVRKAIKSRGKSVELRSGASGQHQMHSDNISNSISLFLSTKNLETTILTKNA
jgi:hypothetical protein